MLNCIEANVTQAAEKQALKQAEKQLIKRVEKQLIEQAEKTTAKELEKQCLKRGQQQLTKNLQKKALQELERKSIQGAEKKAIGQIARKKFRTPNKAIKSRSNYVKKTIKSGTKQVVKQGQKKLTEEQIKKNVAKFLNGKAKLPSNPHSASRFLNEKFGLSGKGAFKPFTKYNYRHNLKILTKLKKVKGIDKIGSNVHAHHMIPQEFAQKALEKGVNVHDPRFMGWIKGNQHRQLHGALKYNNEWEKFFDGKFSEKTIIENILRLAEKYGLVVPGLC